MPDCIPAPFKKMGGRSQICSYIRYFVCVGINGITAAHGHMEFHFGSRSRDLYAHASRIYHGILSGEYDNGQRICCSDGEDAHSTKNRDSYVGGIPIFPTVKEEYTAIRDAMKMRGITTFRNPMKMLEYRIVPLMMSIAKIGEELSAAALTRGLGAPQKRTNICKIGFGPLDIFFFLLAIPCWVGFFIC